MLRYIKPVRCTCTGILIFIVTCVNAQPLDSLWLTYQDTTNSDSIRLTSLHRVTRQLMYSNPDSAYKLALAEEDMARRMRDSAGIANALNLQGGTLTFLNEFSQALDIFERSIDIRRDLGDSSGVATGYNNIGNVFFYKGYYPKALHYYQQGLDLEERIGDDYGIGTSLINVGSVYAQQGDFSHAREYFEKALSIFQRIDNPSRKASILSNLGNVHRDLGNDSLALAYYAQAVPIMDSIGDMYTLAITYSNMGNIFEQLSEHDKMFDYYRQSEQMRETLGDRMGLARLWVSRGLAYVNLNQFSTARRDCIRGLELAESVRALPVIRDACNCLYQVYKNTNQNELALQYHEKFNQIADSIASDETRRQLQLMEFRQTVSSDSIKREREKRIVAEQHAEELYQADKQKVVLTISGALMLMLSVFLVVIIRRVRKSKARIEEEKLKTDELLLNILPADVADELKATGKVDAREFDNVTVMFTDFVGFTRASESMEPRDMLETLSAVYGEFDLISKRHNIRKIKSIGDGYMAAGGLPIASNETIRQTVLAALDMQEFLEKYNSDQVIAKRLKMRVGIHTGPVVTGIVGFQNFQYDLWGDTVNLANRLESHGVPGEVNISRAVFEAIKEDPQFTFVERGIVQVKGKRGVEMWLVRRNLLLSTDSR